MIGIPFDSYSGRVQSQGERPKKPSQDLGEQENSFLRAIPAKLWSLELLYSSFQLTHLKGDISGLNLYSSPS